MILSISFMSRKLLAACSSLQGRMGLVLTQGTHCFADDFNRVILSMKRGQEYTDYINASFIDVSAAARPCLCACRGRMLSSSVITETLDQLAFTIRKDGHVHRNPNHFISRHLLKENE